MCDGAILDSEIIEEFLIANKNCTLVIAPKVVTELIVETQNENLPPELDYVPPSPMSGVTHLVSSPPPSSSLVISPMSSFSNVSKTPPRILKSEIETQILLKPGGKEMVDDYKKNQSLCEKSRKRLVNIVCEKMVEDSGNYYPDNETKIAYAKACIELFPSLRDPYSSEGYVSKYNLCLQTLSVKLFFRIELMNQLMKIEQP